MADAKEAGAKADAEKKKVVAKETAMKNIVARMKKAEKTEDGLLHYPTHKEFPEGGIVEGANHWAQQKS